MKRTVEVDDVEVELIVCDRCEQAAEEPIEVVANPRIEPPDPNGESRALRSSEFIDECEIGGPRRDLCHECWREVFIDRDGEDGDQL